MLTRGLAPLHTNIDGCFGRRHAARASLEEAEEEEEEEVEEEEALGDAR